MLMHRVSSPASGLQLLMDMRLDAGIFGLFLIELRANTGPRPDSGPSSAYKAAPGFGVSYKTCKTVHYG